MRVLVDTHTLLWAVDNPTMLSQTAHDVLSDSTNELLVSMACVWETSIKYGIGKLTLSQPFRLWIERAVSDLGATLVPITIPAADVQASLPLHHRDPFDRMLIAQSQVESIPIVTRDTVFDQYAIPRIW